MCVRGVLERLRRRPARRNDARHADDARRQDPPRGCRFARYFVARAFTPTFLPSRLRFRVPDFRAVRADYAT